MTNTLHDTDARAATRLSKGEIDLIDAYWRAANYLTVGQIYLRGNALLREPLSPEHIKPRLLGHWGTSPGLSMLYCLLNRHIRATDSDWLNVAAVLGEGELSRAGIPPLRRGPLDCARFALRA